MSRGYPEDWNGRRRRVYRRDGYTCQNCGAKGGPRGGVELHAHHVVPKSSGGTHRERNLITVCKACHKAIHGRGRAPTAIEEGSFPERVRRAIERHYRSEEGPDEFVRLGKSGGAKSESQATVDDGRNQKYRGCPSCGKPTLTVSWVGMRPGKKVKVVECSSCSTQYEERLSKMEGNLQRSLHQVDGPKEIEPVKSAFFKELRDQIRLYLDRG